MRPNDFSRRWLLHALCMIGLWLASAEVSAYHFPWDQGHDVFIPEEPPLPCDDCNQCNSTGSPFIPASGAYIAHYTDISIPGPVALEITRTYHSLDGHSGLLGHGWMFTYGAKLIEVTDGASKFVIIRRPDGQRDRFYENSDGTYNNAPGVFDTLIKSSETWQLIQKNGTVLTFDEPGNLLEIDFRTLHRVFLTYNVAGALTSVTDDYGRSLQITLGVNGKIKAIIDPAGRQTEYAYDGNGYLISVTDPRGAVTRYSYDNEGNMAAITSPSGDTIASIAYDSHGRVSKYANEGVTHFLSYPSAGKVVETSARGTRTLFYNEHANITNKIDFLGNTERFGFDSQYNLTRVVDKNGNATFYNYDANGNIIKKTDPLGIVTTYEYDPVFNQVTKAVEPGRTNVFSYDAQGNVTEHTVSVENSSRSWRYTYDTAGQLVTSDGPRTDTSDVMSFDYDGFGNVISVTDPLGGLTTMRYNEVGQITEMVEPNGVITTYAYDEAGNEITRVVAGETTTTSYNAMNLPEVVTLPSGQTTTYRYDAFGRTTAIVDTDNNRLQYTLDSYGNALREEMYNHADELVQTRSFEYDALGRMIKETGAAGQVTAYSYDPNGNRIMVTDPLGRVVRSRYDALNRLTHVTDQAGGATLYVYDALGSLVSVSDPLGNATRYGPDGFGDVKWEESPEAGRREFNHDDFGNIVAETDAIGHTTQYKYNAANLLTRKVFSDTTSETRTYAAGPLGQSLLSSIVSPQATLQWTYDPHGRTVTMTQTVAGVSHRVSYVYDDRGRVATLTYPSGALLRFTYSEGGEIVGLSIGNATLLSSVVYRPFGVAKEWTWGNGSANHRVFDFDGNLIRFSLAALSLTMIYDAAGRITELQGDTLKEFSYDSLDRLTGYRTAVQQHAYSYDANGNRIVYNDSEQTTLYTYDAHSSRLTTRAREGGDATESYAYDAAGNVVADSTRSFAYDAGGRMTQVTSSSGTTAYRYNPLGQRVSKSAPGSDAVTEIYVYDDLGRMLGVYAETGAAIMEIVYLQNTPVAVITGANDIYYIYADQIDTPRVITDTGDEVVWRWDSDPFGIGLPDDDPDNDGSIFTCNLRFPGQYFDKESELHYNYLRDYDPSLGRYLQTDPIGLEGGLNAYVYANGNPISSYDPTGEVAPAAAVALRVAIAAAWRGLQRAVARCAGNPVCKCKALYSAYKYGVCWIGCWRCNVVSPACCAVTTMETSAAGACVALRAAYIKSKCDKWIPTTANHPGQLQEATSALANCSAKAARMCTCLLP